MADRITGKAFATRSEVIAPSAMAATSQPLATQVALDILRQGGSAIDAAIAANACLGLMEPTGCGIGGDMFALVWSAADKQLYGYNGSGRAPLGLSFAELQTELAAHGETKIPTLGPLSVSVPGAVDGWFALHERFGKLPMADVLAPAITYAEDGHPVSELIAFYWDRSINSRAEFPGFLETFTVDGKRAPRKGEMWRNPALARTYRLLATEGRDAFYEGPVAETIDAYMRAHGGFLRHEDLAAHRGEWVDPVGVDYRGHVLWELPPNGQGIAAQQILQILEGFDLAAMGFGSADYLHVFTEAKKLAYADRAKFYADMAMADVPVEWLVSDAYADERRALIDMEQAARSVEPGVHMINRGDTIYLAVGDAEGNMVSWIQSNYWGIGSGCSLPEWGFALQNRGSQFSMEPGHANQYAPGKRPFHTIIPAFVTKDDQPLMAFGVMGGGMQPQGHAQIMVNLIDFGMNLQEAGDAPRLHHGGSTGPTGDEMTDGGRLELESGFAWEVRRELELRGHRVHWAVGPYGGYQAVMRDPATGVYYGASESRKDGQAAGF